jgi:hypothetical protein
MLAAALCPVVPWARAQNGPGDDGFRVAMGLMRRGLHDDAAKQLRAFLQEQPALRLAPVGW